MQEHISRCGLFQDNVFLHAVTWRLFSRGRLRQRNCMRVSSNYGAAGGQPGPSSKTIRPSSLARNHRILHANPKSCRQTPNLARKPRILHANLESCTSELSHKPRILYANFESCTQTLTLARKPRIPAWSQILTLVQVLGAGFVLVSWLGSSVLDFHATLGP